MSGPFHEIPVPFKAYLAVSMGAMAQDYLRAAQQEGGCLKEGQRYWASFALARVQSALCERQMRELLEGDSAEHAPIESGALLLVSSQAFLPSGIASPVTHACMLVCKLQAVSTVHAASCVLGAVFLYALL